MINELIKKHPSLKVIKTYPESGQKIVYLVSIDGYGEVILKIIRKMDERIQREILTVNENFIQGVPQIMQVSSFQYNGEETHYLIEEYISGDNLTNVLKKQGKLQLKQSLKLLEDLLKVASSLESLKIVHRDIKPDNIICARDGSYRLIDFGIARNLNLPSITMTAAAMGPHTPGYGAPELFQYDKAIINSKADLFSIGVVTYEAIFGKHPFVTGNEVDVNEIWYKTATAMPDNYLIQGDKDSQLIGLIQTLMQKRVSKRPPSAKKALEWYYIVLDTLAI
ncbi:hypothetical protein MASR2M70_03560 [Bacillota bacterium]